MLNISKENFVKLKSIYSDTHIEESCANIRKAFADPDGSYSVFTTLSCLDTMVILYDDKIEDNTRYISFSGDEEKNYLMLSPERTVEEMRFNAACILARLCKKISTSKKNFAPSYTTLNNNFSREEKYFACALLMPRDELIAFITQKDSNGKYKYIDENNEISFKNINAVADHFGVPFGQCSSRIFHVFEQMAMEDKNFKFRIKDCRSKRIYKEKKKAYLKGQQQQKDMLELVPDHHLNRAKLINHLIDSLHFRSWSSLSDIAKRRLLVNLVKADSVNEGVVRSETEAKAIINEYIASGGVVKNGKLITQDYSMDLTDEQLVVLGEYDLYNKTLERGLITGIAKSNPRLSHIVNLDYKSALEEISERDFTRYICDLHERLFSKLSSKYNEQRGGFFRTATANLTGTNVNTASPHMIHQLMDNLSWRILDTLKKNANGELSNSQYIDKVNECIYEMIRMQPFADGNKRTSRLLSNILYQEKGIPYVFVPVKHWGTYVDAWSSDNISDYNEMMHDLIVESYQYFYGGQPLTDVTNSRSYGKIIINENRNKKISSR